MGLWGGIGSGITDMKHEYDGNISSTIALKGSKLPVKNLATRSSNPSWWVLLGDMGTGKTSLVLRFVKGQFLDQQESTIGAAFFTQILSVSEATVKFDIWDTAGQERYHSLAPMYYRGAAAAVVVYDISSLDTFARAKQWVQELQNQGNPNPVMALVANKSDLDSKREVQIQDAEEFAQEHGMFFMETSAKTAHNVNELFYEIAKKLAIAYSSKPSEVNLNNETQERRGKLFCCTG
ncbi:hypothetical protein V6N13_034034 [Hibiscus sabdariffa]|uniref:Uncharacterized protein n=1 Tax=Hibiscus sabdariffa TaxID=183260 RepID=A0ABR2F8T9_9ROSI